MLDMTPKEIVERKGVTINPCKTCEPVGAMYCALGVHKCMPHSHGSQGCCSYHRTVLSRHFKEPVVSTSSSFTEGASVFGGRTNLTTSVKNIFDIYDPDIIAVHTTCLSETIGDDVQSYLLDIKIPENKKILYASTPSYEGSHIQGFSNMMCSFVNQMTDATAPKNGKIAIFPGWVNPGDDKELKRIAAAMFADFIYLPDHDNTLDVPMTGRYEYYGEGGTTIPEIEALGGCRSLVALGHIASFDPAELMKKKFKVPYQLLPLPVGVSFTDGYVMALKGLTGADVPKVLENERGRLVDLLLDSSPYTSGKKVAIYGDPDIAYAMTSLCLEMGMIPKYVITGTPKREFELLVNKLIGEYSLPETCVVKADTDLFYLHQLIKNEQVDLLLGNSYGKYISKAEDIPIVRMGFPVLDRYGGTIQPVIGYRGGMRMVEKILDALMDRQDREASDEDFECVM
ncbi:MAG: nitrogenase component 1 [Oscillospiraceae bacterium]